MSLFSLNLSIFLLGFLVSRYKMQLATKNISWSTLVIICYAQLQIKNTKNSVKTSIFLSYRLGFT